MIYPTDAAKWDGKFVVMDWNVAIAPGRPKMPTNSGGPVLRADDTYLYLQPFALASKSNPGDPVTSLGLQTVEESIPLVDIETIYAAPLDGITIVEPPS